MEVWLGNETWFARKSFTDFPGFETSMAISGMSPAPKSKPSKIDHVVSDSKHHPMPPSGGGNNGGMAGCPT